MLEYILNKRIEQVIEKTSNIPDLFPSLNKIKILKQLELDFPRNLFLFDNIIIHNLTTFLNILTTYSRNPLEYLYLCILAKAAAINEMEAPKGGRRPKAPARTDQLVSVYGAL